MERTITYEGRLWRVWVNPAPAHSGSASGLEFVFTGPDERRLRHPIGEALLRVLSRDAMELDEELLRQALATSLAASRAITGKADDTTEEKR